MPRGRKKVDNVEEVKTTVEETKEEETVVKEEPLSPAEYFELVKNKMKNENRENVQRLYDTTLKQLKRYMITGQKSAAKELYAKCIYMEKEVQLLDKGVTKYVLRSDIEHYIDKIADDCVCIIEMSNYDRIIPDEAIDIVSETMDIFDEFFVVFTDYTGEKRSKVAAEKRDKDPILFGNIFIDGMVSPKMYFIADWVDEHCDLTLDKMMEAFAKKEKKEKSEILYDISDLSTLDDIEKELFGTSKRVSARTSKDVKE